MPRTADAGEFITCENGHEVFEVLEPLYLDNTIRDEQVGPATADSVPLELRHEDPPHVCPICNASFSKRIGGGIRFHFPDGYR